MYSVNTPFQPTAPPPTYSRSNSTVEQEGQGAGQGEELQVNFFQKVSLLPNWHYKIPTELTFAKVPRRTHQLYKSETTLNLSSWYKSNKRVYSGSKPHTTEKTLGRLHNNYRADFCQSTVWKCARDCDWLGIRKSQRATIWTLYNHSKADLWEILLEQCGDARDCGRLKILKSQPTGLFWRVPVSFHVNKSLLAYYPPIHSTLWLR